MPSDEFRKYGYEIVDWIANYFEHIDEYPVLSQVEPNWLKDNLPASAPEKGENFGDVLAKFWRSWKNGVSIVPSAGKS